MKNLIGTVVISELLYEIFERAERIGKDDMPYFGIYCDEFQEFATPDFAKLFTQTGKFSGADAADTLHTISLGTGGTE